MWVVRGEDIVIRSDSDNRPILKDVSFQLDENRITLFIGKSGSGKTTLLRSIVGLSPVFSGSILIKDKQKVGFVSQSCDLFPHMTVLQNCVHPQVKIKKTGYEEAKHQAFHFLKILEVNGLEDYYPENLSGGQRQRVAIARTLSMGARIMLFDEPTSALDPFATDAFADLLHYLISQEVTIAMSVHDMLLATKCIDRVYLLDNGRIIDYFENQGTGLEPGSKIYGYLNRRDGFSSSGSFS